MNLKLTLCIIFDKWSWLMILSTWSRDFMACLNVDISIKKFHLLLEVPRKVTWHNLGYYLVTPFIRDYPQCKFPSDTMSRYLQVVCIRVIVGCACTNLLDFRQSGLKMFLLNTWSEYQHLVKELQAFL